MNMQAPVTHSRMPGEERGDAPARSAGLRNMPDKPKTRTTRLNL